MEAAAPYHARCQKTSPTLASPQRSLHRLLAFNLGCFLAFRIHTGRGSLLRSERGRKEKERESARNSIPGGAKVFLHRASERPDGGIAAAKAAAATTSSIIRGKKEGGKEGDTFTPLSLPFLPPSQLDDSQNANFAVFLLTGSLPNPPRRPTFASLPVARGLLFGCDVFEIPPPEESPLSALLNASSKMVSELRGERGRRRVYAADGRIFPK